MQRPVVFMDIEMGPPAARTPLGRMKIELFSDIVPKTCENFRQLCTGEYRNPNDGRPQGYLNVQFHRVVKGYMVQGGDVLCGDGTGGIWSIYGGNNGSFADENFDVKHNEPFLVSMANCGPDTNGCQFFITTAAECPWLDGKNVVFGRVVEGQGVVRRIENVSVAASGSVDEYRPKYPIVISQCGEM